MFIEFRDTDVQLFSGRAFRLTGGCEFGSKGLYLLRGGNGSGKTMLLNTLAKLLGDEQAGPIDSVENAHVSSVGAKPSARVARVRQDPRENFISRCSADEMILPLLHREYDNDLIAKKLDSVLDACDITDPKILERDIDRLSAGQQQLLSCCVAAAPDPDLLLLDEPLARLDPIATRTVLGLIESLANRAVVVVASHSTALGGAWLAQRAVSIINVERKGAAIRVAQSPPRGTGTTQLEDELLRSTQTRRRLKVRPGQGEPAIKLPNLALKSQVGTVAMLQDAIVTVGINYVEGANGSGKTFLGGVVCGSIPLNPVFRRSRRHATGTIELPTHQWSSLRSIRRRGMSALVPATPDRWLPERKVDAELMEFHQNGLGAVASELLGLSGIDRSQRISELSFGQKKILTLLSLPTDLELLFLDEPFADLSKEAADLTRRLIDERAAAGTWRVVMISVAQNVAEDVV